MRTRLDVYISPQLRQSLDDQHFQEGRTLSSIVEEYLGEGVAHRRGEVLEQQALPAIRAIIQAELFKALAQLRLDLLEDQGRILQEIRQAHQRSDSRLAALLVRILRESGIGRRLIWSLFAQCISEEQATLAYTTARQETGKDLAKAVDEETAGGR